MLIGRRVVVTGMGMLSPLGNTVVETWQNILAGKSGVALIDSFDVSAYSTRFSASVKNFDVEQYLPSQGRSQDGSFCPVRNGGGHPGHARQRA